MYARRERWPVDGGKRVTALAFSDDASVLAATTAGGLLYLLPADALLAAGGPSLSLVGGHPTSCRPAACGSQACGIQRRQAGPAARRVSWARELAA